VVDGTHQFGATEVTTTNIEPVTTTEIAQVGFEVFFQRDRPTILLH
jgi:hypothetical protein